MQVQIPCSTVLLMKLLLAVPGTRVPTLWGQYSILVETRNEIHAGIAIVPGSNNQMRPLS